MQAALAETETTPASVATTYRPIRTGDVISIYVQNDGKLMKPDPAKGRDYGYVFFGRPIPGGRLNFHVHGAGATNAILGKSIRAKVAIVEKTLTDGRKFIHVDLFPVDMKEPVTARLIVSEVDDSKATVWKCQLPHAPRNWLHIVPAGGKV